MQNITHNIAKVNERICLAAEKNQRNAADITLLAVSKTRSADELRQAFSCGQQQFGENYLQEATEKIEQLQDLAITWHFIGPIQSNKTKTIAELFNWAHSVDRLKIAQRLNEQRPVDLPPLNICLQVNISEEDSKSGVLPAELTQLAENVALLPRLKIRGLMAIPQAIDDIEQQRQNFNRLFELYQQLQSVLPSVDSLSMGMSQDMEQAIAEGATMVRIGTDIFGQRPTK